MVIKEENHISIPRNSQPWELYRILHRFSILEYFTAKDVLFSVVDMCLAVIFTFSVVDNWYLISDSACLRHTHVMSKTYYAVLIERNCVIAWA